MSSLKKYLLLIFGIVYFSLNGLAQNSDSLDLLFQLDTFNIRDTQSLSKYHELLVGAKFRFPAGVKNKYNKKGLEKSQALDFGRLYYYYAKQFFLNGFYEKNFDTAHFYANLGLQYAKKNKDPKNIGSFEGYLGNIYQQHEKYANALNHYSNALNNYEKIKHTEGIGRMYLNTGGIHAELGEYDNAKKYLIAAIPYVNTGVSVSRKASTLNGLYANLGEICQLEQKYDSLAYYLQKSTEQIPYFANNPNYSFSTADAYYIATRHFIELEQYDSAKVYLNKMAEYAGFHPNYDLLKFDYCLKTKSCPDLDSQFQEHLTKLDSSSYFLNRKLEYYVQTGRYKQALETQTELVKQNTIKLGKEKLNYASYMDARFENNKKEKEIVLLKKENELKTTYAWLLFSALLLSLIIAFFIYYQIKQKNHFLQKDLDNQKIIEEQAKELRRNYELKNQFFGNLSHELRTPLTLVHQPIKQLLKSSQLGLKEQQQLKIADDNVQQLLQLTTQILDLTKSEVGLVKTTTYQFSFRQMLNYLQAQFQILADVQEIQLVFPTNVPADIILLTDVEKLLTILRNLLSNALKYSKKEDIVTLSYQLVETNNLEIMVKDSGQGIPAEELSHIFNRYYQSNSNSTLKGGVGIGLAICKEYSKLLKGTIAAKSEAEQGSLFTLQFPMKLAATALKPYEFPLITALATNDLPKLSKDENPKEYLLIVEDNLDLCHVLWQTLEEEYELSFAHNGEEALRQIAIQKPLLVITDWMMPTMDGEALVKHLKEQEDLAYIPILMLTARTSMVDQLSMLRIGVDNYLTKPFEESSLQAHITQLIEFAEMRAQSNLLQSTDSDGSENAPLPNLATLNKANQTFLFEFERFILENISIFDLTIDKIAAELSISPRSLHRKVKAIVGLTTNQYIKEIRFQEAKRMLIEKECTSVKAASYSVGLRAEKHFSRNFKKRFGKNPTDFMRSSR